MKIVNDSIGISNTDKIKLLAVIFAVYVAVIMLFDWLLDGSLKTWDNYLLKGLIYSILFSVLIYVSINKLTKKVELKLEIPLAAG